MMQVEKRPFGPENLPVSLLGFGCGAVGGLMVRGTAADQERAIARAIEAGINYFDTAVQYGDGASEQNSAQSCEGSRRKMPLSAQKYVYARRNSGGSRPPSRHHLKAACAACNGTGWTSFICTMPLRWTAVARA